MHARFLPLALAAFALTCSSCGNQAGLYPVSGKVLFQGEPAVGATVTFVRRGSADPLHDPTPQGIVRQNGTFTLIGPAGEGAPPGDYIVLVEWKEGAGKARGRAPGLSAPDRLKRRYLDPKRPLLTATVDPKSNTLPPFELK
jgi:hypothetical protein